MSKDLVKSRKKHLSKKLKKPLFYNVILLNDDFTTMEFVVKVLIMFFKMSKSKSTTVMLKIHNEGSAICGTYTLDIAQTLTNQVNNYSRSNCFPLQSIMRIK